MTGSDKTVQLDRRELIKSAMAGEPKIADITAKKDSVKHPFSPK